MSDWISVKDHHPKNKQKVIIKTFNKDGDEIEVVAIFSLYDLDDDTVAWGWNIGSRKDIIARPTHWMPLPEPPEE